MLFVSTLEFSACESLEDLFSCKVCERAPVSGDGNKILDGVVMDGKAVGVFSRSPPFQRIV